MPTLILPPRYTDDTNLVRKAAIARGWDIQRLTSWRASKALRDIDPVLYGEPLFVAFVAETLGLALMEAPFNWLTTLPHAFVGRQIQFMDLAQARAQGRAFIKPADDKCFVARVYDSGAELPDSSILPDTTPALVSEPAHWDIEFRCFVLERQLATLSPYLRGGNLIQAADGSWPATEAEIQQATTFINRVLTTDSVRIPPAVVIDVGIITGVGWAVIEANPVWASGMYGCDPHKVLDVLQRACIPCHSVTATEAEWLPNRNS